MTSGETPIRAASALMLAFAERTGVVGDRPPERYLWTDAFAVCNFLGLARATGDPRQTELALRLVHQAHRVLGWHRSDEPTVGWLSGLDETEGSAHPTAGGLRIGKHLPERPAGEPMDERLEWDRDGQYFHYLTKWMHALDQTARATGQPQYNLWARELADVAHRAFTVETGPRMVWKMSVDLSRPLVPSMGQHDPVDGLVTCLQLQATAEAFGTAEAGPPLERAMTDFAAMVVGRPLATDDPLGIGGLLTDAARLDQLVARGKVVDGALLDLMLESALEGLPHWAGRGEVEEPAEARLAFRELGLAIGLKAFSRPEQDADGRSAYTSDLLGELAHYTPIARTLESFWLERPHQEARTWLDHRNIDEVVLATTLAPEGFLALRD